MYSYLPSRTFFRRGYDLIRFKIVFIFDDLELGDIESRIITRMIVSDAKSLNSTIHKYININNTFAILKTVVV